MLVTLQQISLALMFRQPVDDAQLPGGDDLDDLDDLEDLGELVPISDIVLHNGHHLDNPGQLGGRVSQDGQVNIVISDGHKFGSEGFETMCRRCLKRAYKSTFLQKLRKETGEFLQEVRGQYFIFKREYQQMATKTYKCMFPDSIRTTTTTTTTTTKRPDVKFKVIKGEVPSNVTCLEGSNANNCIIHDPDYVPGASTPRPVASSKSKEELMSIAQVWISCYF